jgi:hypothetical protein
VNIRDGCEEVINALPLFFPGGKIHVNDAGNKLRNQVLQQERTQLGPDDFDICIGFQFDE